jgi:cell division septation protein DedD
MKLRWLVVTVCGVGVLVGCSEKQKEAARLEAAMKNGDSAVMEPAADTTAAASGGQFDSAVAQISAQIAGGGGQGQSDTQSAPTSSGPDSAGVTHEVTVETGDAGLVPAAAESTEQMMDAGAIPQEELPKTAPQETTTPSAPTGEKSTGSGYVVQVVSTPDESEANTMVARFVKGGYRAFKTMAVVEGSTYFRVRVGRYETVAEAEAALSELHDKYKVSGFVTLVR